MQEYADPVIDWLELERKYFSARYYRQHCTYRNGAYIKDLAQVEPDLSKVMILDNSPMSYIFHEGELCQPLSARSRSRSRPSRCVGPSSSVLCAAPPRIRPLTACARRKIDNAIPIEGWISDPTDHDLLNLVPLLEGLQYSTDVRALLALRLGEAAGG